MDAISSYPHPPTLIAKNKHDLVIPTSISLNTSSPSPPPTPIASLFTATTSTPPHEPQPPTLSQSDPKTLISTFYTYKDSPSPPFSRDVLILSLHSLPSSPRNRHELLTKALETNKTKSCIIAVKCSPANCLPLSKLDHASHKNSSAFNVLIRHLHSHALVAFCSVGKGVYGLLLPSSTIKASTASDDLKFIDDGYFARMFYDSWEALCGKIEASVNSLVYPPFNPSNLWLPSHPTTITFSSSRSDLFDAASRAPSSASSSSSSSSTSSTSAAHVYPPFNINNLWKPSTIQHTAMPSPPLSKSTYTPQVFGLNLNFKSSPAAAAQTSSSASSSIHPHYVFQGNNTSSNLPSTSSSSSTSFSSSSSSSSSSTSTVTLTHLDPTANAADKFYSSLNRTQQSSRSDSYVYHMRNFNGWVKACLISSVQAPPPPQLNGDDDNGDSGKEVFKFDASASASNAAFAFDGGAGGGESSTSYVFGAATADASMNPEEAQGGYKKNAKRKGAGAGNGTKKRKPNSNYSSDATSMSVLDLACGKGGDLGKWCCHRTKIRKYVGVDVATGSLIEGARRAQNFKNLKDVSFIVADLGHDVIGCGSKRSLSTWDKSKDVNMTCAFASLEAGGVKPDEKFDVVSIQFAIHYMMSSRARARRFFKTLGDLIEMGGSLIITTVDSRVVLEKLMNSGEIEDDGRDEPISIDVGNGSCSLKFERSVIRRLFPNKTLNKSSNKSIGSKDENQNQTNDVDSSPFGLQYLFTLYDQKGGDRGTGVGEAVELPEWLTPMPVLEELAAEAGLVLKRDDRGDANVFGSVKEYYNFQEFFKVFGSSHENAVLMRNMNVVGQDGRISQDEWDVSGLYCALTFVKVGASKFKEEEFAEDEEAEVKMEVEMEVDAGVGGGEGADSDSDSDIEVVEVRPATMPAMNSDMAMAKGMLSVKRLLGEEAWGALSSDDKTRKVIEHIGAQG